MVSTAPQSCESWWARLNSLDRTHHLLGRFWATSTRNDTLWTVQHNLFLDIRTFFFLSFFFKLITLAWLSLPVPTIQPICDLSHSMRSWKRIRGLPWFWTLLPDLIPSYLPLLIPLSLHFTAFFGRLLDYLMDITSNSFSCFPFFFRRGVFQRLKVSITRICEFGAWTWCAICLICL